MRTTERSTVCVALATGAATCWLAWLLTNAPQGFDNVFGFAPEARRFTPLTLFQTQTAWTPAAFTLWLRVALVAAWAAWCVTVVLAASARPRVHVAAAIAAGVVAAVAVLMPPMLSRDVLGYVAYGRMLGIHGLDPYRSGRDALGLVGDPAAAFLDWETPMPYGPLWVMVASAVAWVTQGHGLWLEIALHKALAAGSLLAGAAAATALSPRHAGAALLAMSLNPLLLVESAGSGHNDAAMTAMLVIAAALGSRGHDRAAAVALGISVSVKPVALAALPLLLAAGRAGGAGLGRLAALVAWALAPLLMFASLVGGPAAFAAAVAARASAGPPLNPTLPIAAVLASTAVGWLQIARSSPQENPRNWLLAWVPLAIVLAVVAVPLAFPWYLTWALMPALTRLDRRAVPYVAAASALGAGLMWNYSISP